VPAVGLSAGRARWAAFGSPEPLEGAAMRQYLEGPVVRRTPVVLFAGLIVLGAVGAGWWAFTDGGRSAAAVHVDFQRRAPDAPPAAGRAPLRIAVAAMISPKTTYGSYEKLLDRVGGLLGRPVQFVQRKSYQEVNDLVERREVDLAFVCSGPYVTGHARFGMELLVAPVAHGQTVYHSYILVRADSALQSFDDLRGRTFAFTDPDSNSGCLVPTYMLACRGETPQTFFGDTFYSHGHDSSIKAVVDGTAAGAAVDSLIYEYAATLDPSLRSQTRILLKSPPYGIPPVVVHPALRDAEKAELRRVFLGLHADEVARPLLRQLQIERFERVDDRLYESVRQMLQRTANTREGVQP
jgi:phosphonate transport system substrate-binding protein